MLKNIPKPVHRCPYNVCYSMTAGCQRKCIPPKYKDSELSKAEAVCIDRCVAKYMEVHERVGRKLTEMSMQDTTLLKSANETAKS